MNNTEGVHIGESKLVGKPKKPVYAVTKTKYVHEGDTNQEEINKRLWEAFQKQIVTSGTTTIGPDGYWYVDGEKTEIKAVGENGKDADVWTIGADDFWYVNGTKTIFKSKGEDGKSPLLRISTDGQSLEISSDGGQTWLSFEKNFNKLRVLGYVSSVQLLPKNANIGDIYGVWNPDVYSGRVDEEGHLIKGAYDLYVNTVRDWVDDYHITKVYDYDTELPSSAANGTTVLVPVDYLTLDKTKIDGYKVYRFSLDKNGWMLILDTAEIYASKDDIINYGDNVYALVQGDEEHTYELYRRDVGWVYFGTNASITYVLVQDIDEGAETNIPSGKAVKDAYGRYIESPEFVRAYLDGEDKVLWGIKTDGTVYFGAGVPPQVKDYIEERIGNYDDIITFLDDLEEGDETLRELLNEKVDKEEGKSLIDEEYAEGVHYIENPEFVEVKLDQEDRILEATMLDGTKLLPAGYEIGNNVVKTISNPEYLAAWLDSFDHILFALKADGDVIFGCGIPSQIKKYVNELIKPFEELFHYEDNPEFIDVKLDSEGKILEGIKPDGTKYLGSLNISGVIYYVISSPEWLKAVVDSDDKIICGIKANGTFCVVDIDFLDSSNKIKEVLNHFDAIENPEFLSVELDANEKILGGRKIDGTKFENAGLEISGTVFKGIDDPEDRIEVKTDSDEKIISYRKEDGTLVENVGIETNRLEFTQQGMTDFQQALKDSGFTPGGGGDLSDKDSAEIPMPRCAYVNITSPDGNAIWPTSKSDRPDYNPGVNADLKYFIEFYDGAGNYFKKEIIFSAQGNSSMAQPKKNGAFDICNNNGWDDDDTFKLKIGDWPAFDSFHVKAFNTDFFRGVSIVAYQIADRIALTRDITENRPWKKALLESYTIGNSTQNGDVIDDMSLQFPNEARCMPDGFPCIIYLNGDFYGIYAWSIKKHRDNYHMNKKTAEHIHLDGTISSSFFAGSIDWTAFEVRNPKNIYCQDGTKYNGDFPQEIMGEDSQYYDSTNKDHKRSVKVKKYIQDLSHVQSIINAASTEAEKKELIETYFDKDNLIDYVIVQLVTGDPDGFSKNWQWTTWDGKKWFVCNYDKDCCFGINPGGAYTMPPFMTWVHGDYTHPYASTFPTGYTKNIYLNDTKLRYAELRNKGVISANFFISLINDWMGRFGQDNFIKEYKKWSDAPCNREGSCNEGWKLYDYQSYSEFSAIPIYNPSTTYNSGDKVRIDGQGLAFEATDTVTNVSPIKSWGCKDNFWRVCNWIKERILLEDSYLNYNV